MPTLANEQTGFNEGRLTELFLHKVHTTKHALTRSAPNCRWSDENGVIWNEWWGHSYCVLKVLCRLEFCVSNRPLNLDVEWRPFVLQNLRIRCSEGSEFYTRSSAKVKGCLGHRFMFIDGDKAVSGSYRWASWVSRSVGVPRRSRLF